MEFIKKQIDKHKIIVLMAAVFIFTGGQCLIKKITGFPCPSCGLTRAIVELLKLNFQGSLYYNPLAIPIILILIYFIYGKKPLGGKKSNEIIIITVCTIIVLFVYIYRMYTLFPNIAPMDYNKSSILWKAYEFIKTII